MFNRRRSLQPWNSQWVRVEVNKFWVSLKNADRIVFFDTKCVRSPREKLLKAQLSVNFQNDAMCVAYFFWCFWVGKSSFALSKQAFLEETFNGVKTRNNLENWRFWGVLNFLSYYRMTKQVLDIYFQKWSTPCSFEF